MIKIEDMDFGGIKIIWEEHINSWGGTSPKGCMIVPLGLSTETEIQDFRRRIETMVFLLRQGEAA